MSDQTDFLDVWRAQVSNINVFRSLCLHSAEKGGAELAGPLVIDIDSSVCSKETGYTPDIDDSLNTARRIVRECLPSLHHNDYRVFFTGHKGFSIEVRPQVVGVSHTQSWERGFRSLLQPFKEMAVGTAMVDKVHYELRLHDSVNHWMDNRGCKMYRMKYEVSLPALWALSADDICSHSEELATAERR